ncbi:multidrug efflux SMR transporter [Paenibacillus chitinolyticus]|uniref:DMT family transporter n=1 Tax=Paenibacillus chitinolyticus TaxID=79263 RepID=UPI002DBF09E8|nr:multidrug efflux SMR transporter [Paenibacillus chitinolyticus]MEC0249191.1 multidrug efflux SMR transporter [Paenibacillus chitinolyticus]
MAYLYLFIAILLEVFSSVQLKLSQGFKRFWPALFTLIGYGTTFYFLALSLKSLPMGIVFATWSGIGTALTVLIGILFLKEKITMKAITGLCALLLGLFLLNFV